MVTKSFLVLKKILTNAHYTHYNLIMKDKDLLKLLIQNGWKEVRINGSHHRLEKDGFPPITIPVHGKDMKKGLEIAMLKQAKLR